MRALVAGHVQDVAEAGDTRIVGLVDADQGQDRIFPVASV